MTEQDTTGPAESQEPEQAPSNTPTETKPAPEPQQESVTYESVLAGLSDDQRKAILGEVSKKNSEAKGLRDRVKDLEPKAKAHEQAQEAQRSAEEKAAARQAEAEERAKAAEQRAAFAEVKALASDKFADPADAATFVDLTKFIGESGGIDSAGLASELDDLLDRKPYLGKPTNGPRPPAPTHAQGSSGVGPPAKTSGTDVGREMFQSRRKKQPTS